jgi:PAS domain S-box-containing protein
VSYTPLLNAEGEVYAVLDTAIDVTESIMARKAIEEAEASLRGAIDLADLATWSLDPETMVLTYSEKLLEWFGLPENGENVQKVLDILHEDDRERVTKSLLSALEPESDGTYDEEYTIINRINGRERVLHAQGKTFYSDDGKPYILRGTAQDITNQKRTQLALENEVKARTEELYAANRQLTASNEELAQYAYVASHDLQEPLRKITMFSNLLSQRNTETEHQPLIEKITKASQRMSLLIKDLLEFSRLLSTDTRYIETDLNTIVNAVKEDFELLVQEKDAVLESGQLPVINAVPLQMNQLFYNLISNALKFVPQDRKPHIVINCELAENALIEEYIHNADKLSKYYRISIRDNGIGIEEQYAKQIFDVFKRLHARDEFSGSGIGLAICRRIVINHNGAIYIESVVGEGTTFNIILPERQLTTIV